MHVLEKFSFCYDAHEIIQSYFFISPNKFLTLSGSYIASIFLTNEKLKTREVGILNHNIQ